MHCYTAHGDCVDIAVAALLILPLIKLYALNILHFTLSLKMKCHFFGLLGRLTY